MISLSGLAAQFTELVLAVLLAPLLTGWVNQCRAWLQNRSAPPLLQPYRALAKLFQKDVVLAHNASPAVPLRALPDLRLPVRSPRRSCRRSAPTCR